jgi:Ca-activated chloride channel family protein
LSFATPLALLALLVVPLALGGYVLLERRRRARAAAFANPALVPNLVGRRPGRLRHLAPALALIALALIATGLARPHATVSVPREEATVVLALDVSRSMVATDVKPTRLAAAQDAVRAFLAKLPEGYRVSIVSFAQAAYVVLPPTADRELAERALANLRPGDGTALGGGIARAVQVAERVRGADGQRPPAAIVLLSDGAQTIGEQTPVSAARRARALRIPISTVALGTANGVVEVRNPDGFIERVTVPPDPRTLRRVAALTRARFYEAPDGERLRTVYEELGSRVGREDEEREITAVFAAAGALLFLGAGAASAFLFGRLP